MASDSAWNAGLEMGKQRVDAARAHKQALSDMELQGKITDLIENRKAIQAKLPTLLDDKGQPTPQYAQAIDELTKNAQALREVYHPQTNPSAIASFGHLLTDALHITKPEDRIKKEAAKREGLAQQDEKTAQGVAAAAPIPPEQQAARQYVAQMKAQLSLIDSLPIPEDQKQKYRDGVFKVYQKPRYGWVDGPDGTPMEVDMNDPESWPAGAKPHQAETLGNAKLAQYKEFKRTHPDSTLTIDQWTVQQKSVPIRAWKKDANGKITSVLLDRQTNQPIPGSENSDILPPPYLTARISTGVYHWTDDDNQIHETPESHTSAPVLPGGSAPSAPSAGVPKAAPKAASPASSRPSPSTGKSGDKILGSKGSAPLNKARSEYSEAQGISTLAHDVLVNNPNSEKDYQFVLTLIRSDAGRVALPEIEKVFKAGGVQEGPERWVANTLRGELSPNLRKQLVDFSDSLVKSAKAKVDALHSNPTDLKNQANKMQWPKAPDIGTVEDGDDGKHKYIGGDPAKQESWQKVTQ